MTTNWNPVIEVLMSLALTAVPVIAGKLWFLIEEKATASRVARLSEAVKRAAGAVMADIMASKLTLAEIPVVREASINRVVTELMLTMGDTIKALNGTELQITAMVKGEVGKLQAV